MNILLLKLYYYSSGQYCPVINLQALNQFVETHPFKMESLQVAKSLIQPGDYLMKTDLKGAYYTVPIHPDHCCYLQFAYLGTLYKFGCLPFGLSSAPQAFTKLLKPVVLIRSPGIWVVVYLDDILLLHQNKDNLVKILHQVISQLWNLGFTIKLEKCLPHPTQQVVFLGGLLDSLQMTISLPPPKLDTIIQESQQIQKMNQVLLEELISDWQDEPRCPDRCLDGTIVLPESSVQSIISPSPMWQALQAIPSHLIPPEHNGAPMVVIPSNPHLQWPTLVHSSLQSDHFNRCLSGRLGSNLE